MHLRSVLKNESQYSIQNLLFCLEICLISSCWTLFNIVSKSFCHNSHKIIHGNALRFFSLATTFNAVHHRMAQYSSCRGRGVWLPRQVTSSFWLWQWIGTFRSLKVVQRCSLHGYQRHFLSPWGTFYIKVGLSFHLIKSIFNYFTPRKLSLQVIICHPQTCCFHKSVKFTKWRPWATASNICICLPGLWLKIRQQC